MRKTVKIIGAGLAGTECALYLADRGIRVELYEMKPQKFTPAHSDKRFAELVCSNSLKSNDIYGNVCRVFSYSLPGLPSPTTRYSTPFFFSPKPNKPKAQTST